MKMDEDVGTYFDKAVTTRSERKIGQPELNEKESFLLKCAMKYPRCFNLFVYVIFPILLLVAMCFLCGFILAMVEKDTEIKSNDLILQVIFSQEVLEGGQNIVVSRAYQKVASMCIDKYSSEKTLLGNSTDFNYNGTEMKEAVESCMRVASREFNFIKSPFEELLSVDNSPDSLTFNWIRCPLEDDQKEGLSPFQYSKKSVIDSFNTTFNKKDEEFKQAFADGSKRGAKYRKEFLTEIKNLSGHDHCNINTSGGAIFWFSVMTTVGYGNTVPQSIGGKSMVYTLGFVSILLFAAVNANAGYVSLAVADDFFQKRKLKSLTKGMGASVFWLGAYFVWNLVISFITMAVAKYRGSKDSEYLVFSNAYWFSYITTTTVGFGDYHIPHETTYPVDFIYIPFMILIGFVFLANFLIKFSEWIFIVMSEHNSVFRTQDLHELLKNQSQPHTTQTCQHKEGE